MLAQQGFSAPHWFEQAARHYIDGHQACPWCYSRHCVFLHERNGKIEYHCSCCDFLVCKIERTGACFWIPGAEEELV